MLRKIKLSIPQSVTDDVLVRQHQINIDNQLRSVQKVAEKKAQHKLAEARDTAQRYAEQAWTDGYIRGLNTSLEAIIAFISSTQHILKDYREHTENEIRNKLSTVLHSPSVSAALLNEWAEGLGTDEDTTLTVHLPEQVRETEPELLQHITVAQNIRVEIHYHCDSSYIFRANRQIAEFVPEVVAQKMSAPLTEEFRITGSRLEHLTSEAVKSVLSGFETPRKQ